MTGEKSITQILDADFSTWASDSARSVTFVEDTAGDDQPLAKLAAQYGAQSHVCIYLQDRGKLHGLIVISYSERRTFNDMQRRLYEAFSAQANIIAQNYRLAAELQANNEYLERQIRVLETLNLLANSLGADTDEQVLMDVTMQSLVDATGADHAAAALIEPDGESALVVSEYPLQGAIGARLPAKSNPVFALLLQNKSAPILIEDIAADPRIMPDVYAALDGIGVKSLIIAPLVVGDKLIGSVGLDLYTTERHFALDVIDLVDALTSQLAIYLQDTRERRARERSRDRAQAVDRIAGGFAVLNHADDLIMAAAHGLAELLSAERVSIRLGRPPTSEPSTRVT
jgi:GAF domain-containing protein